MQVAPPVVARPSRPWYQRAAPVASAVGIVAFLLGIGVGRAALSSDNGTPSSSNSKPNTTMGDGSSLNEDTSADDSSEEPEPEQVVVRPRDFKFGVKIREKECFGSAGCNVVYQINPRYIGADDLSEGTWDITYRITGPEDGPALNTMRLEDGTFSFDEEEFASTPSSSTVLRAHVTRVDEVSY